MHAALEKLEAGAAGGVEGDDFAIEDGAVAVQGVQQIVKLGVARGDVDLVAAFQVHAPRIAVAEGADAVPFPFEGVVVEVGWQVIADREHRLDARRERVGFAASRRIANRYRTTACHEASWLRPP